MPVALQKSPAVFSKTYRLYAVDALRGLSALAVLIWHYQHFYMKAAGDAPAFSSRADQPYYQLLEPFYENGGFAVQIFWAISGLVMSHAYLNRSISAWNFFVARWSRLYPLHFLTLILVAGLQWLSYSLFGHFQIYPENDVYHFILHLFFVSGWGFAKGWAYNAPIWSVSLEIAIYAGFFFLLPIIRSALGGGLLFLLTSGLAFLCLSGHGGLFLECAAYFYLGTLVHLAMGSHRAFIWLIGISVLSLSCIFLSGLSLPVRVYSLACLLLVLVAGIDACNQGARHLGSVSKLGDAVYASYLLHVPIQILINLAIDGLGFDRVQVANSRTFFWGFILGTMGISLWVFRWIEMPLQHYFRVRLSR
jgi:peptidoglycan/LPS O-acetylase OafA/YrhL